MGKIFQRSAAFKRAIQKAGTIVSDKDRMNKLIEKTQSKLGNMNSFKEDLRAFFEKVLTFIRMVRSYINGSYRDFPIKTLVLIIAGLVYFIMPVDFIPDFIPGIGMVDDISIVLSIFNSVINDVRAFQNFENEVTAITDQDDEDNIET